MKRLPGLDTRTRRFEWTAFAGLSLAGFVASMAHTLDRYLADSAYYSVGADLNLVEGGEYTGETPEVPGGPQQPTNQPPAPPSSADEPALWNFLPVSDHRRLSNTQPPRPSGEKLRPPMVTDCIFFPSLL